MDIEQILDRVAQAADAPTDSAIARAIGLTPGGVRNARRRKTIPYESICLFAEERGLSLDFLLFGKSDPPHSDIDMNLFREVTTALASDRSAIQKAAPEHFAIYAAELYNTMSAIEPSARAAFQGYWLAQMNVEANYNAADNIRRQLNTEPTDDAKALPESERQQLEELLRSTLRMARLYERVAMSRAGTWAGATAPPSDVTPPRSAIALLEEAWGRSLQGYEQAIILDEWSEGVPSFDLKRLKELGG